MKRLEGGACFCVDRFDEVVAQLALLAFAALCRLQFDDGLQRLGQSCALAFLLRLQPLRERIEFLLALRRARDNSGPVPVDSAVMLGKGPAIDHHAGLQAHLAGRHLQTHPFARRRQRAHVAAFRGPVCSP